MPNSYSGGDEDKHDPELYLHWVQAWCETVGAGRPPERRQLLDALEDLGEDEEGDAEVKGHEIYEARMKHIAEVSKIRTSSDGPMDGADIEPYATRTREVPSRLDPTNTRIEPTDLDERCGGIDWKEPDDAKIRAFVTGATRDNLGNKLCYEGFLSPIVLHRFAQYMHKHRMQPNGTLRTPDNWQKGMPIETYEDSLIRHVMDAWRLWRHTPESEVEKADMEDLLCAIMFNTMGMLHEILK